MSSRANVPKPEELAHVEELLGHFEHLEAQFQQLRDGLTHSHRLATLGTIASIVAHEYNNILTPVISYAQLALADPDDHALMRKAVEKALAGAERAAKISSSLLGFARDSDDEPVALLPATIADAISCLGRDLEKDGITLQLDVPDVMVALPPLNLQHVMLNLILNARKAMKRGGRLRIVGSQDGSEVRLEVADTGPGVPAEILDRLFEPFVTQELDSSIAASMESKGTGLGLCICRELLRNAGGRIELANTPGQGATFLLTLPCAEEPFEST
jgi:signal transduction histidine kinase